MPRPQNPIAEVQYGGFANLLYDIGLGLPITPYVGAGAGYQAIGLDRVHTGPLGSTFDTGLKVTHGAFAYQGIAGLAFDVPFVPGLALTLDYHLVGVQSPAPYYRGPFRGNNRIFVNGVEQFDEATLHNTFNHEIFVGLRYTLGSAPAPLPAAAPPPAAPPAPVAPAARTYLVFFDWDRADLTERARQIVGQAASAATTAPGVRIDVNGYTDLSGTAAYNQRLSVRRAQAVQAELVRDGVAAGEIAVRGYGESNPLVPTAPGVREPQNRRVEIVLH